MTDADVSISTSQYCMQLKLCPCRLEQYVPTKTSKSKFEIGGNDYADYGNQGHCFSYIFKIQVSFMCQSFVAVEREREVFIFSYDRV